MTTLSQAQIVQVARAGGLPGDPEVWAAIAMAESSGQTDIVNSIGCVGLWQINQPVWVKTHPTWTQAWLKNPVNNAKAAAFVYRAQGFSAWQAYTGPDGKGSDGPWREYYKGASGSVSGASFIPLPGIIPGDPFGLLGGELLNGGTSGIAGTAGDVATGIGGIAEAVQKTAKWVGNPQNWVRVGYVVGGSVLVLLGLQIIARPILTATPYGKAATAAIGALGKGGGKGGK